MTMRMLKKIIFVTCILLLSIFSNYGITQWVQTDGIYGSGGEYPVVARADGNFFSGSVYGVYVSSDNGASWTLYRIDKDVVSLAILGSYVFAGTDSGVYRSSNNGLNWSRTPLNVTDYVWSLAVDANTLWAGTNFQGIWYTTDYGNTWTKTTFPVTIDVAQIAVSGSTIYAGTIAAGLLRSTDNGNSWSVVNWSTENINAVLLEGNTVYACPATLGIWKSTNNGSTWSNIGLNGKTVFYLLHSGNNIFASTQSEGLYLSTNNGSSWVQNRFAGYTAGQVAVNGTKYVINIPQGGPPSDSLGVWTTTNLGATWTRTGYNIDITVFQKIGTDLYAMTNTLYKSTTDGLTWNKQTAAPSPFGSYPQCMTYTNGVMLAGTYGQGIYRSTNLGVTWVQIPQLSTAYVFTFTTVGNIIFAGISTGLSGGYGIWKSTDLGLSWTQIGLNNTYIYSLASNTTTLFAGTAAAGVYKSTDFGTTWVQTPLNNRTVNVLYLDGNKLWAGTVAYGVYSSTDNGQSWTQTSLNNKTVKSLVAIGNTVIAGILKQGVYVSSDAGTTWTVRNENLPFYNVMQNPLLTITNNGYVLVSCGGVKRRPLSEITGAEENLQPLAKNFTLGQNYPNPFNPVTKISFTVPVRSKIIVSLYNILGEKIRDLTNHIYNPGVYEIKFDGSDLSSGIYYYKMTAEDFVQIKKMVLLK